MVFKTFFKQYVLFLSQVLLVMNDLFIEKNLHGYA